MKVTDKSAFRYCRGDGQPGQPGHVNANDALASAELAAMEYARLKISQPERIECDCPECLIHGRTVALHRRRDCDYAVARSALVAEAEKIATEKVGESSSLWAAEFNRQMDRLAYNAGLLG